MSNAEDRPKKMLPRPNGSAARQLRALPKPRPTSTLDDGHAEYRSDSVWSSEDAMPSAKRVKVDRPDGGFNVEEDSRKAKAVPLGNLLQQGILSDASQLLRNALSRDKIERIAMDGSQGHDLARPLQAALMALGARRALTEYSEKGITGAVSLSSSTTKPAPMPLKPKASNQVRIPKQPSTPPPGVGITSARKTEMPKQPSTPPPGLGIASARKTEACMQAADPNAAYQVRLALAARLKLNKKNRPEEQRLRKEAAACLAVKKVAQRLKCALVCKEIPDNLQELVDDLQHAFEEHREDIGSLTEKMVAEMDQITEEAKAKLRLSGMELPGTYLRFLNPAE
eukprot:TRINITY_DN12082_c0_g1_i1.p1 TRINITY_DN12082_c0_g1~~TRINITY_DN12082_c0_g1_i1.p1  ORF type:complete len:340 (+),score=75.69 TRINITY_DN12082_c0_g1_i1:78-1097(+)